MTIKRPLDSHAAGEQAEYLASLDLEVDHVAGRWWPKILVSSRASMVAAVFRKPTEACWP